MDSIDIKEKNWIELELKDEAFEYPRIKVFLSFDFDHFRFKAIVQDLHFKDGDCSWRYGDGFLLNFITKTYPDNKESRKFYAYGLSVISDQSLVTLVNHNGTFVFSTIDMEPEINFDLDNNRAFYKFDFPWSLIKPFHPLLNDTMGINIQYTSQNDDGSQKTLQLVRDEEFESELKLEKQYSPVHFIFSEESELQFAFEFDGNLIQKENFHIRIVAHSPIDCKVFIKNVLINQDGFLVSESEKTFRLKVGFNRFGIVLTSPNSTGSYTVQLIMNNELKRELSFYRLCSDTIHSLKESIRKFELIAQKPHEKSSYYGLVYSMNKLEEQIEQFDPQESPLPIEQSVRTITDLLNRCEAHNHIYVKTGHSRTAFLSHTDNTIQPYSIYLPNCFDLTQKNKLCVALHGSGVNELGSISKYGELLAEFGYVTAAPRGRGLSDWYVGETENDILDLINTIKEMFSIDKVLILGGSMGGYGAWRISFKYPHLFSGVIISSGAIRYPWQDEPGASNHPAKDIRPLRKNAMHIPYLVMHGLKDRSIPFRDTKEFVDVLVEEGFNITFKIFEDSGHHDCNTSETIREWLRLHG